MSRFTIFNTPVVTPCIRALSRAYLWLVGWKLKGGAPDGVSRYVVIASPHTSNWDFPLMLAFAFLMKAPVLWMGKDALFAFPIGSVTRWLGGIPIDRSKANSVVARSVDLLTSRPVARLLIPVEGTRAYAPYWKSGFYHIARGAGVPLVLGFLDYGRREGGFGPCVHLTGDAEFDMGRIRGFYAGMLGRFPSKMGPIALAPEQTPAMKAVSGETK